MASNRETDDLLPLVWAEMKANGADMLWVGSYKQGWQMERNEATGVLVSRVSGFSAIHRRTSDPTACIIVRLQVREEHIDNGKFGSPRVIGPNGPRAAQLGINLGDLIECAAAERPQFGYRGASPAPDAAPRRPTPPRPPSNPRT